MELRESQLSPTVLMPMVRLSRCLTVAVLFFILGCLQVTVICSGYGDVFITVDTPMDPSAVVNFVAGDLADYNTVNATLSCEEYGWGATSPELEIIDDTFTCQGEFSWLGTQQFHPLHP